MAAGTTEFDFEDLLFAGARAEEPNAHGADQGAGLPARREIERHALGMPHRRQKSALSAAMCAESLQALSLDQPIDVAAVESEVDQTSATANSVAASGVAANDTAANGVAANGAAARRATIASLSETLPSDESPNTKWSCLETSHPLRLGSSAPVCIPHGGHPWARMHETLAEVEEEDQADHPKATTFVPPHLMVDKPAIQFSLHGSTAEKKAKLRARNTILQMTGFLEPEKSEDNEWDRDLGRAIRAPGALTREFGVSKLEPWECE